MSTGILGIGINIANVGALGGSYSFSGAAKTSVNLYFMYDSDLGKFGVGVSHNQEYIKSGHSFEAAIYETGKSETKETVHDANTIDGYTIKQDDMVQEKESGRIGILTVTESETNNSTANVTVMSAEVQSGLVGVGADISVQIEDYEKDKK